MTEAKLSLVCSFSLLSWGVGLRREWEEETVADREWPLCGLSPLSFLPSGAWLFSLSGQIDHFGLLPCLSYGFKTVLWGWRCCQGWARSDRVLHSLTSSLETCFCQTLRRWTWEKCPETESGEVLLDPQVVITQGRLVSVNYKCLFQTKHHLLVFFL